MHPSARRIQALLREAGSGARVLVITSGANRVSSGFPIGGVPPIGHTEPLRILIDRDLMEYTEIWAAAGTPFAVFPTTPQELVALTGGEVVEVRED